jgi:hypothetical protein
VVLDAQHRPLVSLPLWNQHPPPAFSLRQCNLEEDAMGRGLLLWMVGVPIPVIILLWLFFGH